MKSCNVSMYVFRNVAEINKIFLLFPLFFIQNPFSSNQKLFRYPGAYFGILLPRNKQISNQVRISES